MATKASSSVPMNLRLAMSTTAKERSSGIIDRLSLKYLRLALLRPNFPSSDQRTRTSARRSRTSENSSQERSQNT